MTANATTGVMCTHEGLLEHITTGRPAALIHACMHLCSLVCQRAGSQLLSNSSSSLYKFQSLKLNLVCHSINIYPLFFLCRVSNGQFLFSIYTRIAYNNFSYVKK
jgi:hypothetical protein